AGELTATIGRVGSLTRRSELGCHDLVDERDVGLHVEDRTGQLDRTGLLTRGVDDVESGSGHDQAPFTALRTKTMRPRAPGTAPLTSRRPFSTSTEWTLRFCTVTRPLPMRPAMRCPLKTRLGVAEAAIEPGLRWLRCAPCEAATPAKLWRFMPPAQPLPLLVPTTPTS